MNMLSLEEREIIHSYPLGKTLNPIRHKLEASAAAGEPGPWEADGQQALLITTKLMAILMAHDVAFHLKTKSNGGTLATELSSLLADLLTRSRDIRAVRPLVQTIIDRRPDEDVWDAVLDLLDTPVGPVIEVVEIPDDAIPDPIYKMSLEVQPQQTPSQRIAQKVARARTISDKVYLADAVRDNDYFYPFDPNASPREQIQYREAFKQAVLRDLDRLYIRIVEEANDCKAFSAIAKSIRALGRDFRLWEFEVATFGVVKKMDIELSDFEVFRGLRAWSTVKDQPHRLSFQSQLSDTSPVQPFDCPFD